ncbi:MAG: hndC, partial [Bacteroidetes bacterium]|nr:hndC [Bacteroidota bacterium]
MEKYKIHLLVCQGNSCDSLSSEIVLNKIESEVAARGFENQVQFMKTGCFGFCGNGPIIKVLPDNIYYTHVTPSDIPDIITEHVLYGRKLAKLNPIDATHTSIKRKQIRIALRNCGVINPEDIRESIAHNVYQA